MIHFKIAESRAAHFLYRHTEPQCDELLKCTAVSDFLYFQALRRRKSKAEGRILPQQFFSECNGIADRRINLLCRMLLFQLMSSKIRQQHRVVVRRIARLAQNQIVRLT